MSTDIDQATFTETVGKRFGELAFMDDEFTRQWLSGYLHHGSAVCPECHKAMASGSGEKRFRQFQRVKCPSCGKFFTAATGTWLSGSKLDPRQVVLMAFLADLGVSADRIGQIVGVSVQTVRDWLRRFQVIGARS